MKYLQKKVWKYNQFYRETFNSCDATTISEENLAQKL